MALYRQRFDLARVARFPVGTLDQVSVLEGDRTSLVVSTLVTRDRAGYTVSPRPATPPNMAFQTIWNASQCNDALTAIAIHKLAFRRERFSQTLVKHRRECAADILRGYIYPIFGVSAAIEVDQNDKAVGLFQIPLFE